MTSTVEMDIDFHSTTISVSNLLRHDNGVSFLFQRRPEVGFSLFSFDQGPVAYQRYPYPSF